MKKNILISICVFFLVLWLQITGSGEEMNLSETPVPEETVSQEVYNADEETVISPTAISDKDKVSEEDYNLDEVVPLSTPAERKDFFEREHTGGSEENTPDESETDYRGSKSTSFVKNVLNTVTSLVFVCLLVYVVLKLFYAKGAGIVPQARKNIIVVEQVQLQPQKTLILSLIKVGSKVLLIGATEKEISTLREFELNEFPSIEKKFPESKKTPDFKDKLDANLEPAEVSLQNPGFLARFFQFFGLSGIASLFSNGQHNINEKDRGN